jgi:hypothetical protein
VAIPKLKDDSSPGAGLSSNPDDYWNYNPTLEELARQQGTRPAERFEDFAGGWPEDELDDGFEEALERFRQTSSWDEA